MVPGFELSLPTVLCPDASSLERQYRNFARRQKRKKKKEKKDWFVSRWNLLSLAFFFRPLSPTCSRARYAQFHLRSAPSRIRRKPSEVLIRLCVCVRATVVFLVSAVRETGSLGRADAGYKMACRRAATYWVVQEERCPFGLSVLQGP